MNKFVALLKTLVPFMPKIWAFAKLHIRDIFILLNEMKGKIAANAILCFLCAGFGFILGVYVAFTDPNFNEIRTEILNQLNR